MSKDVIRTVRSAAAGARIRDQTTRGLVAFAATLAGGTVVVYTHTMQPPIHFDYAVVYKTDGLPATGFYIGKTGTDLFIAPAIDGHRTCRVVAIIPTKEITRIALIRGQATQARAQTPACKRLRAGQTTTH